MADTVDKDSVPHPTDSSQIVTLRSNNQQCSSHIEHNHANECTESATPYNPFLETGTGHAGDSSTQGMQNGVVVQRQNLSQFMGISFNSMRKVQKTETELVSELVQRGVQYLSNEVTEKQSNIEELKKQLTLEQEKTKEESRRAEDLEKQLQCATHEKEKAEQEFRNAEEQFRCSLANKDDEIQLLKKRVQELQSRIGKMEKNINTLTKQKDEAEKKAISEELEKTKEKLRVAEAEKEKVKFEKTKQLAMKEATILKRQLKEVRLEYKFKNRMLQDELAKLKDELVKNIRRAKIAEDQQKRAEDQKKRMEEEAEERCKQLKLENDLFTRFLNFQAGLKDLLKKND